MRTTLSLAGAAAFSLLVPVAALALGIHVIIDGNDVVFTDVSQSSWFATYVHDAAQANIVNGYKDESGKLTGRFGPQNSITFAEALKIASESAGYDEQAYGSRVESGLSGHWASPYFSVAKGENFAVLAKAYRPDRTATRAEVASMFASAFGVSLPESPSGTFFKDVQLSANYATAIEALARDQVVSGDTDLNGQTTGTFRPTDPVNRAEVVKFAMNARAKYGLYGSDRMPSSETESSNVTYRSDGFSPSVLHVKSGTTVTFENDSQEALRVASNPHPTHTDYPGFDSGQNIATGQEYKFTFTKTGTWGYHNHARPSMGGTVIVE
jgi:plastocyanin